MMGRISRHFEHTAFPFAEGAVLARPAYSLSGSTFEQYLRHLKKPAVFWDTTCDGRLKRYRSKLTDWRRRATELERRNLRFARHRLPKYSDLVAWQTNFYRRHGAVGYFRGSPMGVLPARASDADRAYGRSVRFARPSSYRHVEATGRNQTSSKEARVGRVTHGKKMHLRRPPDRAPR